MTRRVAVVSDASCVGPPLCRLLAQRVAFAGGWA